MYTCSLKRYATLRSIHNVIIWGGEREEGGTRRKEEGRNQHEWIMSMNCVLTSELTSNIPGSSALCLWCSIIPFRKCCDLTIEAETINPIMHWTKLKWADLYLSNIHISLKFIIPIPSYIIIKQGISKERSKTMSLQYIPCLVWVYCSISHVCTQITQCLVTMKSVK